MTRADGKPVEWAVERWSAPYLDAVAAMEARAAAIAASEADEMVWLLEHPPLYTAGVSARAEELLQPERLPVFTSGRGGRVTYHGPGQRVCYLMLDVKARGADVRAFVAGLEAWIIAALSRLGVSGETRPGRVGVWVVRADDAGRPVEEKIAAIGVRLRRWVSFHGVALNVAPDLTHFDGIIPCGDDAHGATSLAALGVPAGMALVDAALQEAFIEAFGPTVPAASPLQRTGIAGDRPGSQASPFPIARRRVK
ncbi:MAG TPA: lipoyl(octanoyl) transferase LipB [Caulobacteraceae bacterium]|nr:lipoyl(octanoyl) transferase LipB [Caulobacteraceae bacterium]